MRPERLLMCMPYRQLIAKATAAGFRVYSIWDPALESADYLQEVADLSGELALVSFQDEPALRRTVTRMATRHDVARILHLGSEAAQLAVAQEATRLGLAVNPPASIRRLNDKAVMRALLRARGLSPVWSLQAASPADARRIVRDRDELPVVVKPARLDGSRAVRLIEQAGDVDTWARELAALGYRGPVLVEEYLRGPEFSVETLTVAGRHHVLGITAKRLGPAPHFVEMGHVHPAPLPGAARAAIVALVQGFLCASGYRFGPAHTEVILTPDGPRIVESQARLGGDRIPLLMEIATGVDVEAAVFTALAGRPVPRPAPVRVGCISFFDFGTGRVRAIDGVDAVAALPFVHSLTLKVAPGDRLSEVRSSRTRHGYVVVDAASAPQAAQRVAAVRALLTVRTDTRRASAASPLVHA